jgi:hypothetical protein
MHCRGLVSPQTAAELYGGDPRTIKRLWREGAIDGEQVGDKLWIWLHTLEAHVSGCPRCPFDVDGEPCGRVVFGEGPGCNREDHQRRGQHHSPETKAKMSAALKGRQQVAREANELKLEQLSDETGHSRVDLREAVDRGDLRVVRRVPWPNGGEVIIVDRDEARADLDALPCSEPECENPAPGDTGRCAEHVDDRRLQEGHRRMRDAERDAIRRVKREQNLVDVKGVQKRLRREGLWRSTSAISGHVRAGLLVAADVELRDSDGEPLQAHGTLPALFVKPEVDKYVLRLKQASDGRVRRWARPDFRAGWHLARHKSTAEYGRHAPLPRTAHPQLEPDELTRARSLLDQGKSIRATAIAVGLSKDQVWRLRQSGQS